MGSGERGVKSPIIVNAVVRKKKNRSALVSPEMKFLHKPKKVQRSENMFCFNEIFKQVGRSSYMD